MRTHVLIPSENSTLAMFWGFTRKLRDACCKLMCD